VPLPLLLLLGNSLENISAAMNTHTTIEELFDSVFNAVCHIEYSVHSEKKVGG
jgi:hypothetical protein